MSDLCMSTDFRFAWMGQPSAGPSAPWPCAPDGRMRRPAPRNVGVTQKLDGNMGKPMGKTILSDLFLGYP